MKKIIDGNAVDLTPQEVSARQAEESAWLSEKAARDAKEAQEAAKRTAEQTRQAAIDDLIIERAGKPGATAAVTAAADHIRNL